MATAENMTLPSLHDTDGSVGESGDASNVSKNPDAREAPRKQDLWKPEQTPRPAEPEMSPQLAYQLQQQRAIKNQQHLLAEKTKKEAHQKHSDSPKTPVRRSHSRDRHHSRHEERSHHEHDKRSQERPRRRSARRERNNRSRRRSRRREDRSRRRSHSGNRSRSRRSRSRSVRKFTDEAPEKKPEKKKAAPPEIPNLGGKLIASRGEWAEYLRPCGEDRYYINVITKEVIEGGNKPPGWDRVYQHSGFTGHMLQNMQYAKMAMIAQDTPTPVTGIPGMAPLVYGPLGVRPTLPVNMMQIMPGTRPTLPLPNQVPTLPNQVPMNFTPQLPPTDGSTSNRTIL